MTIFDRTMGVLQRALDTRNARHQVIAANVANEETPGYRAKDLDFREALAAAKGVGVALRTTDPRHVASGNGEAASGPAKTIEVAAPDLPLDANSVNLDLEMAKLMENALQYNTEATVVSLRLKQLVGAIRDAR